MNGMTIQAMVNASHGLFFGNKELLKKCVNSMVTDSRLVQPGGGYVAIEGARVDGHDFIGQAFEKGTILAIGEKDCPVDLGEDRAYIKVPEIVKALGDIAHAYMKMLNIPVVGITGSVGKTSTKEVIAAVLASKYRVGKTLGNHNNEIGLPLTCFTFDKDTEIAVLEMGIAAPGEMDQLTDIVKPDVAVITNIGVTHMEILGSREGIFKEKTKILRDLPKKGLAVICGDDDMLCQVEETGEARMVSFGLDSGNLVSAINIKKKGLLGTEFTIKSSEDCLDGIRAFIKIPGKHMVVNALAAATIGAHFGLSREEIRAGIETASTVAGRSNIVKTKRYILIDDCYNASPVSMKSAIDILQLAEGRKVAILGDMFELGPKERQMHYDVGQYIHDHNVDVLVTIGNLSEDLIRGLGFYKMDAELPIQKDSGNSLKCNGVECYSFSSNDKFKECSEKILKEGDSILLKASNSMRFSDLAQFLKDR